MDFSTLLAKEIAKKKAEAKASSSSTSVPKYLTKAQLEKNRQDAYLKDQQEKKDKVRKRQLELEAEKEQEKEERKKKLNRTKNENELISPASPASPTSSTTTISRLRELNEPITIFGESDKGRQNRLVRIEKKLASIEKLNQELEEDSKTNPLIVPQDIKDNKDKVYIQMRVYLKQILSDWNSYLSSHPDESTSIYKETSKDIEILLDHLRNQTLDEQIFPSLATLLYHLQNKQYRNANDTYIQLSIGNAAWPIGVIGVAIHERSAQSKITGIHNSSNPSIQTAHIMSNDSTRRWLTAVKRIITFSETHV